MTPHIWGWWEAKARQVKIKDNQDNTEHKETCLDIPDVQGVPKKCTNRTKS